MSVARSIIPRNEQGSPEESANLRRVDKLVHLYDATPTHAFTEWALKRRPLSMKAFCDLFLEKDSGIFKGLMNHRKYIWVNEDAVVRYYSKYTESDTYYINVEGNDVNLPLVLQHIYCVLILERTGRELYFHVHALHQDAADKAIEYLLSLEDNHFSKLKVSRRHLQYYSLPLTTSRRRRNHRFDAFYNLELTNEQQRMIMTLSKRILLHDCSFHDGGAAVLNRLQEVGADFVPVDLHIEGHSPFDNVHWAISRPLVKQEKAAESTGSKWIDFRPNLSDFRAGICSCKRLGFCRQVG
jgi:hypothetical protein